MHSLAQCVSCSIQVRGSIPLYWNQDSAQRMIKPDIQLQCYDPLFAATRLHFKVHSHTVVGRETAALQKTLAELLCTCSSGCVEICIWQGD